jgi:hypothetical protein
MKTRIRLLAWILLAGLLWSCTLSPIAAIPSETPVPATATDTRIPETKTLTKTLTLANTPSKIKTKTMVTTKIPSNTSALAADIEVNLGVVKFVIPAGLAQSASLSTTTREEWPYINPSVGPLPEHWVITLKGYALNQTDAVPEIIIFHADEFAEFSELTGPIITALRQLQSRPNDPVPAGLMISGFCAHIYKLPSAYGTGVRYLTQVFMDYFPVNNEDIFYYYVGLSSDGGYYISIRMPINASFLPADSDMRTPLPAGGIPFPEDVDNASFFEYLQKVSMKINNTKPDEFNPSLYLLDALAQSIQIQ